MTKQKKAYNTPEVQSFGSISNLTQANFSGSRFDNAIIGVINKDGEQVPVFGQQS